MTKVATHMSKSDKNLLNRMTKKESISLRCVALREKIKIKNAMASLIQSESRIKSGQRSS